MDMTRLFSELGQPPAPRSDDGGVERALTRLEELLDSPGAGSSVALAASLHALEMALRAHAAALADLPVHGEVSLPAIGRAGRLRRRFDDLAGRAEALGVAVIAQPEARLGVRRLVADVRDALHDEAGLLLDAYWLDVGVGD